MAQPGQNSEDSVQRALLAERRLSIALELAQMIIWELDNETREVRWWGDDQALYGRPLTYDVINSDDLGLVHLDDRALVADCWRAHKKGGVARCEYRVDRSDETVIWVSSSRETVLDPSGRRRGLFGVLRDITHKKVAEAALAAALKDANTASRAKSEFVANMSHEIRTPPNDILGVDCALAATSLIPTQHETVQIIESSGRALQVLLSDVLNLSFIESGRLELMIQLFNLAILVGQICLLFKEIASQKWLFLKLNIQTELEELWYRNPVRIRQILPNSLSNTVKFTERVDVTVNIVLSDLEACCLVGDAGIGFEEDFIERLFGRFTQQDTSITRRFRNRAVDQQGSGRPYGGRLTAEAKPGRGVTFRLTLPLERAAPLKEQGLISPKSQRSVGASARPLMILLAEDHPTNRRVVELILNDQPVELRTVEDGARALEAGLADKFDLILMDMQLPVMDGLTATRANRARERELVRPPTPICMLTANALPEHVR